MVCDIIKLWTAQLAKTFKEAHLEGKIKFQISDINHVGDKFKNAVKESQSATFINDATHIIAFKEETQSTAVDDEEKVADDNTEEKDTDVEKKDDDVDAENNDNKEDNKDAEKKEEPKDDNKDDEDKEDKVNESVKVQDLSKMTSSVQSVGVKKSGSSSGKSKCCCGGGKKKCCCGDEKEEKKDDKECKGKNCEKVDEAETTASGAELKKKIINNVARCFFFNQDNPEEKVEVYDLENYMDGANIYFCKLSLTDKRKNKEQQ